MKFKIGDTVRCVLDENDQCYRNGAGWEKDKVFVIDRIANNCYFPDNNRDGVYGIGLELVYKLNCDSEKNFKETMEIEEIKKIKKSILAEANEEVLLEIENEQKLHAKKLLRELYNRKIEANKKVGEADSELKSITKDLKSLTRK